MTDTKHTPTPWRVEGDTTLIWGHCDTHDLSDYGMGYPIAECRVSPMSTSTWCRAPYADEGEANAAHIVKCVNMHDELVAALENLADFCEGSFAKPKEQDDLIEALRVLKKAGAL